MSIRNCFFGHRQAGDTIVEVAIAIAVIATVLTGAFVVTNHSLTAVRDSEEHSEALSLLQGQVEQLRNAASQQINSSTLLNKQFCFDNTGAIQILPSATCTQNSYYSFNIQQCTVQAICGSGNVTTPFLLTVTWPALTGGTDQEQITYKVQVDT